MEAREQPEAQKSPEVQAKSEAKTEAPALRDQERAVARQAPAAAASEEPAPVPEAYEMVVVEAEPVSGEKAAAVAQMNEKEGSRQLTGTIRSARDHSPLTGASLTVEGENAVAISDMEGRFSVPVTGDTQSMVTASYAGMESQEFALPSKDEIELSLQPEPRHEGNSRMEPAARAARPEAMKATPFAPRPPEPAGGYVQFYHYIQEEGKYPPVENGPGEGLVILRFTVTRDGEVREILPVSTPGEPFTEEAIRLLKEGPEWIPAFNEDGPVEKQVRLRIVLKK